MTGGVATVEHEVREVVRRRGLDPETDRLLVRQLVEEVVGDATAAFGRSIGKFIDATPPASRPCSLRARAGRRSGAGRAGAPDC